MASSAHSGSGIRMYSPLSGDYSTWISPHCSDCGFSASPAYSEIDSSRFSCLISRDFSFSSASALLLLRFSLPKAVALDHNDLFSGCWRFTSVAFSKLFIEVERVRLFFSNSDSSGRSNMLESEFSMSLLVPAKSYSPCAPCSIFLSILLTHKYEREQFNDSNRATACCGK